MEFAVPGITKLETSFCRQLVKLNNLTQISPLHIITAIG
jgi:hypothetical protein